MAEQKISLKCMHHVISQGYINLCLCACMVSSITDNQLHDINQPVDATIVSINIQDDESNYNLSFEF